MIDITESAKKELKKLLINKVENSFACLRLRLNQQGKLGLGIDIKMPDDEVVEYEGSVLLVAERELADSLKDITLDVEETDNSIELVIIDKSK